MDIKEKQKIGIGVALKKPVYDEIVAYSNARSIPKSEAVERAWKVFVLTKEGKKSLK